MPEPYPTTFLVYGDAGSHKSEFAASFPKPILVFCFDPPGKARPYLRVGTPGEVKRRGEISVQEVTNKKGRSIVTLEYYNDKIATEPNAYRVFRERATSDRLLREMENYRTVVLDSVTFMQTARFNEERYRLQKKAKDPRKWYGGVADQLREMLMVRFANFTGINVVVIAHVNEDKDEVHGEFRFSVAAQGKLSKHLPGGFAEAYHAYVDRRGNALLQTEISRKFTSCTQIPAPNPCPPIYKELWTRDE